jgi:hypothetical protein
MRTKFVKKCQDDPKIWFSSKLILGIKKVEFYDYSILFEMGSKMFWIKLYAKKLQILTFSDCAFFPFVFAYNFFRNFFKTQINEFGISIKLTVFGTPL